MSYHYTAKTEAEIERTAAAILAKFPKRRLGLAVDIEGILEDLGMDLLPRRGVRPYAEGYLARDPRLIVVDEKIFTYPPRARFTLAEEVSHLVLEYELWKGGRLPVGANCHELSEQQHFFVESGIGWKLPPSARRHGGHAGAEGPDGIRRDTPCIQAGTTVPPSMPAYC